MIYVVLDQGDVINFLFFDVVQQCINCYKLGFYGVSYCFQGKERLEGGMSKNIGI